MWASVSDLCSTSKGLMTQITDRLLWDKVTLNRCIECKSTASASLKYMKINFEDSDLKQFLL